MTKYSVCFGMSTTRLSGPFFSDTLNWHGHTNHSDSGLRTLLVCAFGDSVIGRKLWHPRSRDRKPRVSHFCSMLKDEAYG